MGAATAPVEDKELPPSWKQGEGRPLLQLKQGEDAAEARLVAGATMAVVSAGGGGGGILGRRQHLRLGAGRWPHLRLRAR